MQATATHRATAYYLPAGLILLKMVLHYCIINPVYDLHRDEYLHLDMGGHLAAGYLSVPPFTAVTSLLIKWLGGSFFWVKFFPALFGALTLLLVMRMAQELKGGVYALLLAATAFIFSSMLRLNMLYQPNSFDVLCWTWVFYLLIRYIHTEHRKCLLWLGVAIGLGFLNKYNILFLVTGLVPAVLLSPQRKVFFNRYLYAGVLVALLLALPNVIWQFRNGMPVLHHMEELTRYQLVNVDRFDFLRAQFLFFFSGFFLVASGLLALFFYRPFRPYLFLGLTYLFVILLFLYLQAKSYYALGLYPMVLAFGGVCWERLFSARWLKYVRACWLVLIIAPFLYLFNVIFPVLSPAAIQEKSKKFRELGMLRWEDGKDHALPQDFADMLGWREMAALSRKAYAQVPDSDKPYTLIMCGNYGQAGALNYYNRGRGMPPARSFSADYVFWFPRMDTLRYIILLDDEPDKRARENAAVIIKVGQVQQPLAREYGTGVYLLKGLSPDLPARFRNWRQQRMQEFRAWR
ncbi:glycosyltransferase family 39 protein [Chitinophaga japonensis]|uniref:Dolichyl-phosphate-mannose-protein mannosyltransferase n=1 Tax=Chitinophaga japonensis TaxID=104662 RepID=A0A562TCY4_CHIJA|nr:glycosyltransferase family 39 protein [Chitinophaga japonensis]TWI91421.1 dolichyl-phosphate-mannose-protein mannosyltransferase [Chitinophaga japonensis]